MTPSRTRLRFAAAVLAAPMTFAAAHADAWRLDEAASRLGFVSIKAGDVGEAHSFGELSGRVEEDGTARVEIALASVETGIDIRNERMREILFETGEHPIATVTLNVDLDAYDHLDRGESLTREVEADLTIKGVTNTLYTDLVVTRVGRRRVLVEPAKPVIIDAGAFGLDAGINELRELAGLDSISLAVPATFSFHFERE